MLRAAFAVGILGASLLAPFASAMAQATPTSPAAGPQDPKHAEELKGDVELGKKYAAEVEKEYKLSKNQQMIERVQRVASNLVRVANETQVEVIWGDKRLNPFEYSFKVIEGKDVNAFSLPGGFVYVYEGLLNYVESDDELAGVLAHEIAHAAQRHLWALSREQSKFDLLTLPLILVAILSGGQAGSGAVALQQLAGIAGRSGWSQKAEAAADYSAFQYLQHTPYNPVGLLTFMERLGRDQRGLEAIDWGIFRTHPPTRERAERITSYLHAAKIPIKRSLVTTSFRVTAKPAEGGAISLLFNGQTLVTLAGPDSETRAKEAESRLNDYFDTVPELYEIGGNGTGEVLGRKKLLLRVTQDDADAAGLTLEELTAQTIRSIKRSLYMLAFRIWDMR